MIGAVAIFCVLLSGILVFLAPQFTRLQTDLLHEVHARFDPDFPGRGVTDYPGHTAADIPKSYAMLLLAELERRRHGIEPELPDLTKTSGRWLLDNAALSGDGTVGWGVPIAWDAYGDGSVNPPNTIYSISTAIVADALLTWMETTPGAPGQEIISRLSSALDTFASAPRTPSGLLPYSLEASDRQYDTFNPAAYLAGQMQRFAKYAEDQELATRLRAAADATVASLIENHQVSKSGSWYWLYSIQEAVSNDLPHASYIIEGLRTYVREGGRLSDKIDLDAVLAHVGDFFDEEGAPRAWPDFQENIARPPRLYDLGMALHLTCSEPAIEQLSDKFLAALPSYRTSDAEFLKYPAGTKDQQPLIVNEYEAYLWRGLISCESLAQTRSAALMENTGTAERYGASRQSGAEVPFVRIGATGKGATVNFTGKGSSFVRPWAADGPVSADGIILQALEDREGGVLISRGFAQNDLAIITLDAQGKTAARLKITHSQGSAPILRAAVIRDDILYLVYYDNPTLRNYLARYRRETDGYGLVGQPAPLPSLEDPAGGTYEMIPAVFLLPTDGGDLYLVGGTLQAQVRHDGSLLETRIANCARVVEAVATRRGPVTLCIQAKEEGNAAPFELHGPDGVRLPSLTDRQGIPFELRAAGDDVQLSFADSSAELARMLQFDLQRTNSGWLEFGTDNVEGRIPWSQIYYLNGFLDFLMLAADKPKLWTDFSDVLAGIRSRLDEEIAIADGHWREGRFATRAFTVDRSLALFAVQTSRLLLLMDRYRSEIADPVVLSSYHELRAAVSGLKNHIDVLATKGQKPYWVPSGTPFLMWPKGSGFYFDGLNVPFNHQNEWAYALVRAGDEGEIEPAAVGQAIVAHFLRRVAPDGRLPQTGKWDYWWGQAYEGWSASDQVSINMPEYAGDHIAAWISFRSIDVMSSLAAASHFGAAVQSNLQKSAAALIARGKLYPFVAYELKRAGLDVELPDAIIRRYIRVSSPWEIQNAAWAYAAELNRGNPQAE